jgi:peptidoglycan/LPS O-acetylase OafA/YrhL
VGHHEEVHSTRSAVLAAVVDLALVAVFVLIGRGSHHESDAAAGFLKTFWPFLSGLAGGWIVSRAWRSPLRIRWSGVTLWLATVAIGMVLRVVSHQGIAVSFVLVATIVLGVFLLGWRGIAALVARRRIAVRA